MREHKYRAWDVVNKRMVEVLAIRFKDGMVMEDQPAADWASFDDLIPLEYTGLKDKNGKEIYEGDILNDPNWWWGPGEVFLNVGRCGPCRGDSVMAYICRNINGVHHNIWNGSKVEVIGNIYENPELIEKLGG